MPNEPQGRVGGTIGLKINGEMAYAKGNFTWNLGKPKKEFVVGSDRIHGYKEGPQVPFIEGEITVHSEFDVDGMLDVHEATITLDLPNNHTFTLRKAEQVGEGTGNTDEGNMPVRFEGLSADYI